MTRRSQTQCNTCGATTWYSTPRGWTSVRIDLQDLGNRGNDRRRYGDFCSERCTDKWIAEQLESRLAVVTEDENEEAV